MDRRWNRPATTSTRLKEAMEAAGMRQKDLVEKTGLDKSAISRYISGSYEPKQKAISQMSRALNVSENWLWGYDVAKQRPNPDTYASIADSVSVLVENQELEPSNNSDLLLSYFNKLSDKQQQDVLKYAKMVANYNDDEE